MAAEAGGDGRAGIGTRLRAAREKKGLTILQAAEKLHVDPRIVESLEAEDFAALGAAVYARGHLRHYAELVDEKVAELQELYANSTRAAPRQPDLTQISRPPPQPDSGKYTGPAVVVLVAIAAVGAVWWLIAHPGDKPVPALVQSTEPRSSGEESENTAPVATTPATSDEHATPDAPVRPKAGDARSAKSSAPGPGKAAESPTTATVGLSAANRPGPATATAAAATTAAPQMTSLSSTSPASPTAPPTSRGKDSQLTLKFSADSWAEVYDATGQRLFYDVGAASTVRTVKGAAPMRIVLGNGAGVALEFNGRPTQVPSTSTDGSVRFIINAHGRAVPATNGE